MLSYWQSLSLLLLFCVSAALAGPVPDEIYALINNRLYEEAEQRLRVELENIDESRKAPYLDLLADVLLTQGRRPEAEAALLQAEALWRRAGDRPALADNLLGQCEILILEGRAKEALPKAEESIALKETVDGLCFLGQAYQMQLKLDEAARYYRQALQLSDQQYGQQSPWSITVRTLLGIALVGRGEYPEALEAFQQIPPDSMPERPLYLAYLYQELGQTDEALRQARAARDIVDTLPEGAEFQARTTLVTCLLKQGKLEQSEEELQLLVPSLPGYNEFLVVMLKTDLASRQGRLSEAERLLSDLAVPESTVMRARLAEERAELAIALDKPEEARRLLEEAVSLRGESQVGPLVWSELAQVELVSGDPQKAMDYADRAVEKARRAYGGSHLTTASTLHNSADLYQALGRADKMEEALRASLEIYRDNFGEEAFLPLMLQTKLGFYELAMGKPQAEKTLRRSLAAAQSLPPTERGQIEVLACLGLAQKLEGEEAVSLLERGLSVAEGSFRQSYLTSLASLNLQSGNLEKARLYSQEMLSLSSDLPLFQAAAYTSLAQTYRDDPKKAEELYKKALELDSVSPISLFTRVALAGTYLDRREPELALSVLQEALLQADRVVSYNMHQGLVNALAVETLLTLGRGDEALKVADDSLARELKRIVARQTAGELAGLPPKKTRELESFDARLRDIEDALGSTDPLQLGRRTKDKQLLEEREGVLTQKRALLDELSAAYPRYSELVAPTPLNLSTLQSVLSSDEVAVLYFLGPRSFLFLVTPQELRYAEIAPASEINSLAERYNRALGSGKLNRSVALEPLEPKIEATSLDEDTAALSKILLDPLRRDKDFVGDRSLIIVPTQSLWMVPFESLPGLQGEKFLVQERSLSYSPSLSLFVRHRQLEERRKSRGAALVLGGAEYGDEVAPLPYAVLEAESVAARWNESVLYTGAQATESAYLKNPGRQSSPLIHFATHGVLGERPALLMTPENGGDGRLDMAEILAAPIGAELVTLSACSSGLGWVKPDEGVVGLSRAFLHAGASSVMVSLWNVNDQSTYKLMSLFYDNLEAVGPSKALRKAQLEMIEAGAPLHQWAPFVVVGTP